MRNIIGTIETVDAYEVMANSTKLQPSSSHVKVEQTEDLEDGDLDAPNDMQKMDEVTSSSDTCEISGQTSDQTKDDGLKNARQSVSHLLANTGTLLEG